MGGSLRLVIVAGINERNIHIVVAEVTGVSENIVKHPGYGLIMLDGATRLIQLFIRIFSSICKFIEEKVVNEVIFMSEVP